jgi:ribosome modulation factor
MAKPEECHGGCTHTDVEHRAFDRGVKAGQRGAHIEDNPYKQQNLAEAWMSGQSVGAWEHEDEKEQQ